LKLEIAVCYTLLETCFDTYDNFIRDSKGNLILEELYRRKIVLNEELQKEYEDFFKNNRSDLADSYESFFQEIIQYEGNFKIVPSPQDDTERISYPDKLKDVCLITEDKLLLSELNEQSFNQNDIIKLSSDEIIDKNHDNPLNEFRLPIIRKVIKNRELSNDLSSWLSRFLKTETNLTIIDNYIYENKDQFYRYFLTHVPLNANIDIYTLLNNGNDENNLVHTFTTYPFNAWNIDVNIISSKKDQHARDIITDKYYIEIDKGMRVFGTRGFTEQSNITISYKEAMYDQCLPSSILA